MSRARTEAPGSAPGPALPFVPAGDGVRVRVRVTPRAARAAVEGLAADAEGRPLLKVCVTAVPADGAANQAVLALLAREWRLPKTALSVAQGASARIKTIAVAGDPEGVAAHLRDWWRTVAPKPKE